MKPKQKPANVNIRIKDIAEKANVSAGTVDRVIHNRGRVAEEVKERVLKIVKELNYQPNIMARMLGSKKQYRFAALLPSHEYDAYWLAPKQGIEKAQEDFLQYNVVVEQYLFNPYDVKDYEKKAAEVTSLHPDGILLSPIYYHETLPFFEQWKTAKIPFVLFNTQIADFDPLSYIGQDSYQSGVLAAKLAHFGNPDGCAMLIAHIDEKISNAQHLLKKEQGFRNYFIQNKLEHKYTIEAVELTRSSQSEFIRKLDAVIEGMPHLKQIFITTSLAYDVARYLEQKHINHIKLIGYDLVAPNIHYLDSGKISFLINQNPKGQGYWGIHQLTDHIVFKRPVPIIKYLPLDIVTKENVSYFLDDDK